VCISDCDSCKGGEEAMGRYIDDPFEEWERDAYAPIEEPPRPLVEYEGSELSNAHALSLIRSTRAQLVTESKRAS
jgi:hypothetical protein